MNTSNDSTTRSPTERSTLPASTDETSPIANPDANVPASPSVERSTWMGTEHEDTHKHHVHVHGHGHAYVYVHAHPHPTCRGTHNQGPFLRPRHAGTPGRNQNNIVIIPAGGFTLDSPLSPSPPARSARKASLGLDHALGAASPGWTRSEFEAAFEEPGAEHDGEARASGGKSGVDSKDE